jgi:hypothetical protein
MVSLSLESTKGGVAAKNASGTSELVPLRQTFACMRMRYPRYGSAARRSALRHCVDLSINPRCTPDSRSLAPMFGRLGGGCFGLFDLSALNGPPQAIVAHSHLITCSVDLFGGFGGERCLRASHRGSKPLAVNYADVSHGMKTVSRLPCSHSFT